mmetsp:Transcript_16625/g.51552  ORF Transcript_16625/g.51552 Transcript_16625/m.51552 type:complete len:456 (+) Transcript_16625:913-2280(+)
MAKRIEDSTAARGPSANDGSCAATVPTMLGTACARRPTHSAAVSTTDSLSLPVCLTREAKSASAEPARVGFVAPPCAGIASRLSRSARRRRSRSAGVPAMAWMRLASTSAPLGDDAARPRAAAAAFLVSSVPLLSTDSSALRPLVLDSFVKRPTSPRRATPASALRPSVDAASLAHSSTRAVCFLASPSAPMTAPAAWARLVSAPVSHTCAACDRCEKRAAAWPARATMASTVPASVTAAPCASGDLSSCTMVGASLSIAALAMPGATTTPWATCSARTVRKSSLSESSCTFGFTSSASTPPMAPSARPWPWTLMKPARARRPCSRTWRSCLRRKDVSSVAMSATCFFSSVQRWMCITARAAAMRVDSCRSSEMMSSIACFTSAPRVAVSERSLSLRSTDRPSIAARRTSWSASLAARRAYSAVKSASAILGPSAATAVTGTKACRTLSAATTVR